MQLKVNIYLPYVTLTESKYYLPYVTFTESKYLPALCDLNWK